MLETTTTLYEALKARDPRFDGRFFVAVRTTGIYCRPICPARTPKLTSCAFFAHAVQAEGAGFRPCLRCRPELAPGAASVDARARLARAVAAAIEENGLEDASLADLAGRLGVTDRHLRRTFAVEFGVTPVAYAQTQRLLLAKRLLTETPMSITDVAMSAGFRSLRRFHALFRARYGIEPSRLRRTRGADGEPMPGASDAAPLTFALAYRPPYDWSAMLAFLAARALPGVEVVVGEAYLRTLALDHGGKRVSGWLRVAHRSERRELVVTLAPSLARVVGPVLARVRAQLDLAGDPEIVARSLGALAAARPGLRVPGTVDGFELAVRAVLGQQITVAGARTLGGRVVQALGEPLATGMPGLTHTFPSAARLADTPLDTIGALGIIRARGEAIRTLAGLVATGELVLAPSAPLDATLDRLRAIKGLGEWTVQYIAMRALGWPDAFMPNDVALHKALGETRPAAVLAAVAAYRPWRSYAVVHLWASLADVAPSTSRARRPARG